MSTLKDTEVDRYPAEMTHRTGLEVPQPLKQAALVEDLHGAG
jgi:hypothetical protein